MNSSTQEADCFRNLLRNRALVLSALFVTVLCFGFAITHQSIGVDDVARNFYLYNDSSWNMIRQGRLLHVLLNSLTGAIALHPCADCLHHRVSQQFHQCGKVPV